MKRLILLASLLAVSAAIPAGAAPIESRPGATIRIGDSCWASVDPSRGFGYWDDCDSSVNYARARSHRGLRGAEGGGDGGGGGGEGGGGR